MKRKFHHFLGLGILALSLSLADHAAAYQADSSPTPDIQATLSALPITVDPQQYSRECRRVHSLHIDADYQAMLESPTYRLGNDGGILTDYGGRRGDEREQYVPQTIAIFGLTAANAWCESGDVTALQLAVNQADWLVRNAESRDQFVVWKYNFPNPNYFAPDGWTSGLGNGQAIVLLTQLYLLGGDPRYLETARQAVNGYQVAIQDGGVRSDDKAGGAVYEEVAHPDAPPTFVLNGHIIAVDSLAFYADATGDATARQLVDAGIQAVRHHLADFDVSSITTYSLGLIPWGSSRLHYAHGIHVRGCSGCMLARVTPHFCNMLSTGSVTNGRPSPQTSIRTG